MSKYGVFSGPNTGKYGPEKTPYLDTFHAVYGFCKHVFYFMFLTKRSTAKKNLISNNGKNITVYQETWQPNKSIYFENNSLPYIKFYACTEANSFE